VDAHIRNKRNYHEGITCTIRTGIGDPRVIHLRANRFVFCLGWVKFEALWLQIGDDKTNM